MIATSCLPLLDKNNRILFSILFFTNDRKENLQKDPAFKLFYKYSPQKANVILQTGFLISYFIPAFFNIFLYAAAFFFGTVTLHFFAVFLNAFLPTFFNFCVWIFIWVSCYWQVFYFSYDFIFQYF